MLDFCQSKKRILPLIAAALGALAVPSQAWDEDEVKEHLKPFLGGYLGLYQVGEEDLDYAIEGANDFADHRPVAGVSLGIAYKRIHTGLQIGYQLIDETKVSSDDQRLYNLWPKYSYDVIPIEGFAELSVLPGRMPVNLLIGSSFGVGLVRLQQPVKRWFRQASGDTVDVLLDNNDFDEAVFMTGTAYAGARINIYNTLILQGQIGWRMLKSDGVQIDDGDGIWYKDGGDVRKYYIDSSSGEYVSRYRKVGDLSVPATFDLSGAFARVDLRWAFSSQFEKDQRVTDRERFLRGERMALAEAGRAIRE